MARATRKGGMCGQKHSGGLATRRHGRKGAKTVKHTRRGGKKSGHKKRKHTRRGRKIRGGSSGTKLLGTLESGIRRVMGSI